jgi:hypothetical protein
VSCDQIIFLDNFSKKNTKADVKNKERERSDKKKNPEVDEIEKINIYAYVTNSPVIYVDQKGFLRDKPYNRASSRTYQVLQAAESEGLPILTTILNSPTLRPKDVEVASQRGTLSNFRTHPGSSFLGAIGEALVIHNLRHSEGTFGSVSSIVVSQPGANALPSWGNQVIGSNLPDILATEIGGTLSLFGFFRFEQSVEWKNSIGPRSRGRVGRIDHGTNTVVSLREVTVSKRFDLIFQRAERVAVLARALQRVNTGSTKTVAVLDIDRAAYFNLSEEERTTLVNTVTQAGGYISLHRDLTKVSIQNARTLDNMIRSPF